MTVIIAMVLDALLGEPDWIWKRVPHPAVLMGQAISWLDKRFNRGSLIMGGLVLVGLVVVAGLIGLVLSPLGPVAEILIGAVLIAQKSLAQHVKAVASGLRFSLAEGRRNVGMIVGRDTGGMDRSAVARGAIESAAENLSDGVVAPVFWLLVGGLPGLLIYKVTNTADSMIGYRTAKYERFGKAAARFDDLLNWIPARLSAWLILAAHMRPDAWRAVKEDAPKHRSPNAGWPEAAMAQVLGVALSGPRAYDGQMRDYPWVNIGGRRLLTPEDIDRTVTALWRTWAVMLGLVALGTLLLCLF